MASLTSGWSLVMAPGMVTKILALLLGWPYQLPPALGMPKPRSQEQEQWLQQLEDEGYTSVSAERQQAMEKLELEWEAHEEQRQLKLHSMLPRVLRCLLGRHEQGAITIAATALRGGLRAEPRFGAESDVTCDCRPRPRRRARLAHNFAHGQGRQPVAVRALRLGPRLQS